MKQIPWLPACFCVISILAAFLLSFLDQAGPAPLSENTWSLLCSQINFAVITKLWVWIYLPGIWVKVFIKSIILYLSSYHAHILLIWGLGELFRIHYLMKNMVACQFSFVNISHSKLAVSKSCAMCCELLKKCTSKFVICDVEHQT